MLPRGVPGPDAAEATPIGETIEVSARERDCGSVSKFRRRDTEARFGELPSVTARERDLGMQEKGRRAGPAHK